MALFSRAGPVGGKRVEAFVLLTVFSLGLGLIGNFLMLLALSYLGTGFGFGDLKNDGTRIFLVSLGLGLADGAWAFSPVYHWSFLVISAVVHWVLLQAVFGGDLSSREAGMVAVCYRVLYFGVAVFVAGAWVARAGS